MRQQYATAVHVVMYYFLKILSQARNSYYSCVQYSSNKWNPKKMLPHEY
eukprot:SAG31_NODE_10795_length_1096_cov_1.591775_1_plen_49_part_00